MIDLFIMFGSRLILLFYYCVFTCAFYLKRPPQNDTYCVGWNIKPYSLTHLLLKLWFMSWQNVQHIRGAHKHHFDEKNPTNFLLENLAETINDQRDGILSMTSGVTDVWSVDRAPDYNNNNYYYYNNTAQYLTSCLMLWWRWSCDGCQLMQLMTLEYHSSPGECLAMADSQHCDLTCPMTCDFHRRCSERIHAGAACHSRHHHALPRRSSAAERS